MKDFVVFDLETTGCNNADTIIEIGAWKFKNGVSVGKFSELVNPRCSISTTITQITGITNEMLSSQLELHEILPLFYEFCEDLPLVGHNISFDYRFLKNRGSDLGLDFTLGGKRTGVCTQHETKRLCPDLDSYKLESLVSHFNIPRMSGEFHRAYFDAYMTKLVLDRLNILYPNSIEPSVLD